MIQNARPTFGVEAMCDLKKSRARAMRPRGNRGKDE